MVYDNVMDLVQAVLDLKNKLCQLPPEAYVMVVKVSSRGRTGTRAVETAHHSPGGRGEGGPPWSARQVSLPWKNPISSRWSEPT